MEQIYERLEQIGIDAETIDAMRGEDENDVKEYTLLMVAMFDDRHEYIS